MVASAIAFDPDSVSKGTLRKLKPLVEDEAFTPEFMAKNSAACKCIVIWVLAIYEHASQKNQK